MKRFGSREHAGLDELVERTLTRARMAREPSVADKERVFMALSEYLDEAADAGPEAGSGSGVRQIAQPPIAQPPIAQLPIAQPPIAQPPIAQETALFIGRNMVQPMDQSAAWQAASSVPKLSSLQRLSSLARRARPWAAAPAALQMLLWVGTVGAVTGGLGFWIGSHPEPSNGAAVTVAPAAPVTGVGTPRRGASRAHRPPPAETRLVAPTPEEAIAAASNAAVSSAAASNAAERVTHGRPGMPALEVLSPGATAPRAMGTEATAREASARAGRRPELAEAGTRETGTREAGTREASEATPGGAASAGAVIPGGSLAAPSSASCRGSAGASPGLRCAGEERGEPGPMGAAPTRAYSRLAAATNLAAPQTAAPQTAAPQTAAPQTAAPPAVPPPAVAPPAVVPPVAPPGVAVPGVALAPPASPAPSSRAATSPTLLAPPSERLLPFASGGSASVPSTADTRFLQAVRRLQRAQRAVENGAPTAALTLLDELDARFPSALLSEERLVTRVLALCASGALARAKRVAAEFVAQSPRSIYAARIAQSCAGTGAPPAPQR